MITNQQPWKAIVNPALISKGLQPDNSLLAVNKIFANETQKPSAPVIKMSAARRYSFDDNGGGYQGL